MKKENWIWMPHPGHFICGFDCRFHLTTMVGKYIVSTLGEYFPDEGTREIHAECSKIKLEGRGDERRSDFLKKIGYIEIGCGRKYETMVFKAVKETEPSCCPYRMDSGSNVDFDGYNEPEEAFAGHMKMCNKWSKKTCAKQ